MSIQPTESLHAKFNPLIKPYIVLSTGLGMIATVILIPLALIWFCGVGQWWASLFFKKLECELSNQSVRVRMGILFQIEKTIPLENIQDITFVEGPLLRRFHLSILKFETAGQSNGQAHNMNLIGVIDAHQFKAKILQRREELKRSHAGSPTVQSNTDAETVEVLRSILARLDEIAAHMRK